MGDGLESRRFLDRLDAGARRHLTAQFLTRQYVRDEIIINQNEESADVYFVLEGLARVTIFSREGKAVAYRDIATGDMFGEYAAIDGAPRSASVIAAEDIRVGYLPVSQFRELVENNPPFTWALLQHLTCQSRTMTARIFEYSTMMVRDRLLAELLRLADAAGVDRGRAVLDPAPTHFELAARISTHREAVSREMSRMAKLRLVSKSSGALILHDVERLRHRPEIVPDQLTISPVG